MNKFIQDKKYIGSYSSVFFKIIGNSFTPDIRTENRCPHGIFSMK